MAVLAIVLAAGPSAAAAESPITAVVFAPDGASVVAASQAGIVEYAWPSLTPVRELECGFVDIHDLAFSPNGEMLAAAGGEASIAGEIELFDWRQRRSSSRLRVSDDVVYSVSWRDDSAAVVAASMAGQVGLIRLSDDPSTAEVELLEGHSRGVLAVEFLSPAMFLSGGVDATIRVWDAEQPQPLRTLSQHTAAVNDLAAEPVPGGGPAMVASASADSTVRFWQPAVGRLVRFARLPSEPLAIAWSVGGKRLFAACRDGRVCAVDPATVEVAQLSGGIAGPAYAIAVAPTGEILVGGRGSLAVLSPHP